VKSAHRRLTEHFSVFHDELAILAAVVFWTAVVLMFMVM